MFRGQTSARSRGDEPTVVVASSNAIPAETKKSSKGNWKPALKKLFSKKDPAPESEKQIPQGDYISIRYPMKQAFDEPKVVPIGRSTKDEAEDRPKSSRRREPSPEIPKNFKASRRHSFIQTLTYKKSTKDLQDREFQKFYKAKDNEEKGLLRQYREEYIYSPGTAAYVPKHAATDLYNCTRQWTSEPNRPSTANAVYVPKQAPTQSNVPKARSTRAAAPRDIPINLACIPSAAPAATIRPTAFESDDQNTDYQKFLRESRIAATRIRGSEDFLNPAPRAQPLSSAVMDNILATCQKKRPAPRIVSEDSSNQGFKLQKLCRECRRVH